jgi:hypothetical protein
VNIIVSHARNFSINKWHIAIMFLICSMGGSILPISGEIHEHQIHPAITELFPASQADAVLGSSGWSSIPKDGDDLYVPQGSTMNVSSDTPRFRSIVVDGILYFDRVAHSTLNVETIIIEKSGRLDMGTQNNPITGSAKILFVDNGPIDTNLDPEKISRGMISFGTISIYGKPVSSFAKIEPNIKAKTDTLTLLGNQIGWEMGDKIVIASTTPNKNEDEFVTIKSIDKKKIKLNETIHYDHVAPSDQFNVAVLIDRNIWFESENKTEPQQAGHIMIMNTKVDANYFGIETLGRTDKSKVLTDPEFDKDGKIIADTNDNPRARYAFHFHKTGTDPDTVSPAKVNGILIKGGSGWGLVNHSSYVQIQNAASYGVFGAGFVTEVGDEIGHIRDTVALRSVGSGYLPDKRHIPSGNHVTSSFSMEDFGHSGHGFWFQGPAFEIDGIIAAGHKHNGVVFWLRGLKEPTVNEDSKIEYIDGKSLLSKNTLEASIRDNLPEKVRSQSAAIVHARNITVFASAGGVEIGGHQFIHPLDSRISDNLGGITVWNTGEWINEWGQKISGLDRGAQGGGNYITTRYSKNVEYDNLRIYLPEIPNDGEFFAFNKQAYSIKLDGVFVRDKPESPSIENFHYCHAC